YDRRITLGYERFREPGSECRLAWRPARTRDDGAHDGDATHDTRTRGGRAYRVRARAAVGNAAPAHDGGDAARHAEASWSAGDRAAEDGGGPSLLHRPAHPDAGRARLAGRGLDRYDLSRRSQRT